MKCKRDELARCEKYAHCRLRSDREHVPYCEEYRRPRYIRDYSGITGEEHNGKGTAVTY